jgi:hypothetical protein
MHKNPSETKVLPDLTSSPACDGIKVRIPPLETVSVPQLPDKVSDPIAELPNPELNPLLNPILGRHLGQWAHVYFTTAPEKREEALFDLLDELKAEEARSGEPATENTVPEVSEGIYAIVCPHCQRSNIRSQKYCGMCGSLMPIRAQAAAAATGGRAFGEALFAPEYEPAQEGFSHGADPRIAPDTSDEPELVQPHGGLAPTSLLFQPPPPLFQREPLQSSRADRESKFREVDEVDIDWLRERSILSAPARESSLWKVGYVIAGAILICFVLVLYLGTNGKILREKVRSTPSQAADASPSQTPPASASSGAPPNPLNTVVTGAPPSNPEPSIRVGDQNPAGSVGSLKQSLGEERPRTAPESAPTASEDVPQSGSLEVAMAKEYLSGKHGRPDGATAAKMLWKAVANHNGPALLLLSDLYSSGNGVPKSCDQARLLLDAAMRKGVPMADAKFRDLQKTCP